MSPGPHSINAAEAAGCGRTGKAVWHPLGTWVIGGRAGQPVLALDITSKDERKTLEGSMRYRNEGDIGFRATLAEPQPEPPPAADAPDTE